MKKTLQCILVFLFVLQLCACTAKVPSEIITHIDSSFEGNIGELKMSGILIYTDDGEMYLDVSTPDELYGLNFSFKDDFTIGYRGLNAVTENGYLPPTSFAQAIKNTLDSLHLKKPPLEAEDSCFTTSVNSESGKGKIILDKNGAVREIEIPSVDIKIKLSQ